MRSGDARGSRRRAARLAVCLSSFVLAVSSVAHAQPVPPVAPSPPPGATDAPVAFDAPVAPTAPTLPDPAALERAQGFTRQLVELEARARQLEDERGRIRTRGLRVGKYISWAAFGVLAFGALAAAGSAAGVDEAIEDGRTDKAYDTDGDGDVDRDDERHSRRIARGMMISSVIPLGLGVFTTVLGRMRARHIRTLDAQLTDIRDRRRSVIDRLGYDLGVTRTQASLRLHVSF